MVEFQTGYWHSMDRYAERQERIPLAQVGIPTHPGKDQLEGLKGRIRLGAKNVELGFFGKGKGSLAQGNTTPGMYGKDERAAMKELAKVNKVNLSVHASAGVSGFAGFTGRNFDEHQREKNIDEVKRAVDFAADTTEGGAVVMHMGEFPRPLTDIPGEKGKMQYYPQEKEESVVYLVDKQTGDVLGGQKKNQVLNLPKRDENGEIKMTTYYDPTTKEKLTVPQTEARNWEYYQKKADEAKRKGEFGKNINPGFLMFKDSLVEKQNEARGWATTYSHQYQSENKELRSAKDQLDLAKKNPQLFDQMLNVQNPMDREAKIARLNSEAERLKHSIYYHQGTAAGKMQEVETIQAQIDRAVPIEDYGSKKTFDSVARLGVFAMEKTKEKKLAKPLFVAPENIWAETGYGAHPDELKDIIVKSREAMAEKLVAEKKMSIDKARQAASSHIKATFDIGHANTWRKHFQGDDKEYNKWLIGKVKDMQKAGVIGHIHMSDNFGYEDEHGTLGEGSAPIQDFLKEIKSSGYEGTIIAEPAHNDYKALLGAWRTMESPIYRVDSTSRAWTDVEHGYFGRTFSPNYTIRTYLPIGGEKEPLTWAGVPLE